jgi:hypothetical protein
MRSRAILTFVPTDFYKIIMHVIPLDAILVPYFLISCNRQ